MSLAANAKTAQSARKYVALHKIRRCETDLKVAKDKVRACEETLIGLRKEVEEAEANLSALETGMAGIQQIMLQSDIETPSLHDTNNSGSMHSLQPPPGQV
jgi:septation ring formation regulator EzrA